MSFIKWRGILLVLFIGSSVVSHAAAEICAPGLEEKFREKISAMTTDYLDSLYDESTLGFQSNTGAVRNLVTADGLQQYIGMVKFRCWPLYNVGTSPSVFFSFNSDGGEYRPAIRLEYYEFEPVERFFSGEYSLYHELIHMNQFFTLFHDSRLEEQQFLDYTKLFVNVHRTYFEGGNTYTGRVERVNRSLRMEGFKGLNAEEVFLAYAGTMVCMEYSAWHLEARAYAVNDSLGRKRTSEIIKGIVIENSEEKLLDKLQISYFESITSTSSKSAYFRKLVQKCPENFYSNPVVTFSNLYSTL